VETVFDADVDPGLVERSLAASTFGSMWLDMPRPEYPTANGSIACDLLVVGGGYTGLWTALHAAQRNPDRHIVLIEANRIGWAASGRNGGFVDASLTHGRENGKARWPNEIDTLEAMGRENLDGMQADIEALGLDAEWQRTGMLSVATEPYQVERLADAAAHGEGQLLGLREVRDEVHSPTYLAGLYQPGTCAIVHPAKLALELARACQEAGVRIYEHTNAQRLDSGGTTLRVQCGAASFACRNAVLATNVFPSLLRRNRLHTVPVYDYVLATVPLTDAQLNRIGWQGRQGIGDCANQFHYYRLTMDNRIVWGGYDAVYHFGRKSTTATKTGPPPTAGWPHTSSSPFPNSQTSDSPTGGRARSTPTPASARTGAWPATAGSPTSTGLPGSASLPRGSPPTYASISSMASQRRGPNWRWSARGRCRFRQSRWPASASRRRAGRWIGPTTLRDGETSCCACSMRRDSDSIPDP